MADGFYKDDDPDEKEKRMTTTTKQNKRLILLIVIGMVCALAVVLGFMVSCTPSESENESSRTPKTGETNSDDDAAANQQVDWTMESNCSTCHTYEAELMADTEFAQAHAHENESCIDCHTEESVLATAHEGITMRDTPAKKATVETVNAESCISCHGTMDEMAIITAGSTALTDSNGVSVNPHELQPGEKHEANQPTCTSCHTTHSKDLSKDSMKFCAQCHHRGVFTCGNCHAVE